MTKGDFSLFENNSQNAAIPLIIVCDEKDMVYANYLIQLIGQKDDAGDSIVGIADDSVSAAIYTTKTYKDNLPQIPSTQHIIFVGRSPLVKEQSKTIVDKYSKMGMHYGWLGKRAVLYVEDIASDWLKLKDDKSHYTEFWQYSKERGMVHTDALAEYAKAVGNWKTGVAALVHVGIGAGKVAIDRTKTIDEVKAQQYRTLVKVFYEDGLRLFMEG